MKKKTLGLVSVLALLVLLAVFFNNKPVVSKVVLKPVVTEEKVAPVNEWWKENTWYPEQTK
jgi:hypothetical protein